MAQKPVPNALILELEPVVQQELRRGGTVVPIEPQVFDVLAYLVQNRDRIVTKGELFEAVWQGRTVSDAALNSRISAA